VHCSRCRRQMGWQDVLCGCTRAGACWHLRYMTGLEKYSRPILRDQVQDQDRQCQDQDQDRQCQYQDQDQDRQKTVSSGLETKTAVSRTTSLVAGNTVNPIQHSILLRLIGNTGCIFFQDNQLLAQLCKNEWDRLTVMPLWLLGQSRILWPVTYGLLMHFNTVDFDLFCVCQCVLFGVCCGCFLYEIHSTLDIPH